MAMTTSIFAAATINEVMPIYTQKAKEICYIYIRAIHLHEIYQSNQFRWSYFNTCIHYYFRQFYNNSKGLILKRGTETEWYFGAWHVVLAWHRHQVTTRHCLKGRRRAYEGWIVPKLGYSWIPSAVPGKLGGGQSPPSLGPGIVRDIIHVVSTRWISMPFDDKVTQFSS